MQSSKTHLVPDSLIKRPMRLNQRESKASAVKPKGPLKIRKKDGERETDNGKGLQGCTVDGRKRWDRVSIEEK